MKSHAPKLLRSTSKARAWYGFALLLGVGVFVFPALAKADLTSPVPVVTGSLYGQADSLGLRHSSNQVNDQDGLAWEFEQTQHRKLVYVNPQSGKELLVAAAINKSNSTCSGDYPVCRLEFRVSTDSGTTWAQALVGQTPYIYILGIKGSGGTKFDYALYVSPNDKDIWVSYTFTTAVEEGRVLTRSKIQKLAYNNALGWTLEKDWEPQSKCGAAYVPPNSYIVNCFGETGVGVQIIGNTERVWGLSRKYCNNFSDCSYPLESFVIVYSDNFSTDAPTWTETTPYGSLQGYGNPARKFGSTPRATFIPIGSKRIPTLVTQSALQLYNCAVIGGSRVLNIMTLKNETAVTWLNSTGSSYYIVAPTPPHPMYSFYYSFELGFNGGDYHCPGNPRESLINKYGNNYESGAYPFAFSAAGVPDGTDVYKSRVVIAYSGGTNDNNDDFNSPSQIRASSCIVTINSGSGTSSINCPVETLGILSGYTSPSVGYYKGKFWISAKEQGGTSNKRLKIFSENTYSPPGTWTWNEETGNTYQNNIASPSAVDYIPSASLISTNSTYIPTLFSDLGGNRVAFDANSGGASIGSNPKYSSNPIWGYGWASNFGWLSLNCINKPLQNCTKLFGLGIGTTPHGDDIPAETDQLQNVIGLSPTSDKTFPIGGYAWSSNAGFLSLERRDSTCNTSAGCSGTNNAYGNPPGLPYNSYTASGSPVTVHVTNSTQVEITVGDCTNFPDGKPVAVGTDYGVVAHCNPPTPLPASPEVVSISSAAPLTITGQFGATVVMYPMDPNVPQAKYDTASQHVYGWGRFLNLCNYDSGNKRCKDKDAGWVRLRGYYTAGAPSTTATVNTATTLQLLVTCNIVGLTADSIAAVGSENVIVDSCSFKTVTLKSETPLRNYSYPTFNVNVYNVTGKEYGLDAFWTGDHYELAGWAWSNDYGWIRFNPLIFIGFSWLETLFGNVYSGKDITLPNAENLSHERFNTCGTGGNEPCYVSTYRIEAGGLINQLTYSGTGDSPYPAGSAAGSIVKKDDPTGYTCDQNNTNPLLTYNVAYCALQGSTSEINLLNQLLARDGVAGPSFPTVGSTTTSYRNALGKLDVGGLTTIIGTPKPYNDKVGSKDFVSKSNRFGNTVYKTSSANPIPTWTINELSGWVNQTWESSDTTVLPLNTLTVPTTTELAPLRSQVVHVQGHLTVDGAEATFTSLTGNYSTTGGTMAVGVLSGVTFPTSSTNIFDTNVKASCAGCALVVDPGGTNEEYFSYTTYAAGSFGVVKCIKTCKPAGTHQGGENVRWVWRLPYVDNGTTNIAQRTTIVVDGDLNIKYNIIAADRSKDADLSTTAAANTIRDLPTIAFVVKGNVIIDPQVNKLTGAFIVTSRNTTPDPDSVVSGTIVPNSDPACTSQYSGCGGLLKTGNDNVSTICNAATKVCRPLTITGLLFARLFAFERIGNLQNNNTPGERVIADERLFLNPPPGLEDVTKALPNPKRTLP